MVLVPIPESKRDNPLALSTRILSITTDHRGYHISVSLPRLSELFLSQFQFCCVPVTHDVLYTFSPFSMDFENSMVGGASFSDNP